MKPLVLLFLFPIFAYAADQPPIVIGATFTMSGENAAWGTNAQRGAEIALAEINASGGVNGAPLRVEFENFNLFDLKQAASAAQSLISKHNVPVLLTQWSEDTEVVLPIAQRANVIVLSVAAGAKDLTKKSPLLFRVWPSDEFFIRAEVQEALKQHKTKVSIVAAQTAYFVSLRDITATLWTQAAGSVPAVFDVAPDTTDYRSIISKIKTNGSDVVFLHIPTVRLGIALKQLHEAGLQILRFGTQQSNLAEITDVAGSTADGMIYPEYVSPVSTFPVRFHERYNEAPGIPAEYAYDAVKILARVMSSSGTSTESIRRGLLAVQGYQGASGTITFDQFGDRTEKEVVLKVVVNGKPQTYSPRQNQIAQ